MADKQIPQVIPNNYDNSYGANINTIEAITPQILPQRYENRYEVAILDPVGVDSYIMNVGGWTDQTAEANDPTIDDVKLSYDFYIGGNDKFDEIIINVTTACVPNTVSWAWKYWNGIAWVSFNPYAYGNPGFSVLGIVKIQTAFDHSLWEKCNDPAGFGYNQYYIWADKYATNPTVIPLASQLWLVPPFVPFVFPRKGGGNKFPPILATPSRQFPPVDIDKIAYDYEVFSGIALDAFSDAYMFKGQSYYLWFSASNDAIIQLLRENGDVIAEITENELYHRVCAYGFKIKSKTSAPIQYQMVSYY